MLNLDPGKLLVIFVVALIVMGPDKLPAVARQLGGVWKTLTSYREQTEEEIRKIIPNLDLPKIPKNPSAMVSSYISDLVNPTNTSGAVLPEFEIVEEEKAGFTGSYGANATAVNGHGMMPQRANSVSTSEYKERGRDDPSMN